MQERLSARFPALGDCAQPFALIGVAVDGLESWRLVAVELRQHECVSVLGM